MLSRRRFLVSASGAGAAVLATQSLAQDTYPNKPIRIVVPYSAGTPPDIVTRIIANRMSPSLGPTVIENKPGAIGAVALAELMRQPADGYTLMTMLQPITVAPSLFATFRYDLNKDLLPVGQFTRYSNILVVHPDVKANTVEQLVGLMKTNPQEYSFASGGAGTPAHLSGELFKQLAKVSATHVPYNQFTLGIQDLVAGRVQFMFVTSSAIVQFIEQGKVRPLAVTGTKRLANLPKVATMAESGYPSFDVTGWDGLVARAGTPSTIIERLNAELGKAAHAADVKERFAALGVDPIAGTPAEFGSLISSEVARWGNLVQTAGIKAQ
jgi:tripartite-type tricarboxylate transporter receptor subunit TctC